MSSEQVRGRLLTWLSPPRSFPPISKVTEARSPDSPVVIPRGTVSFTLVMIWDPERFPWKLVEVSFPTVRPWCCHNNQTQQPIRAPEFTSQPHCASGGCFWVGDAQGEMWCVWTLGLESKPFLAVQRWANHILFKPSFPSMLRVKSEQFFLARLLLSSSKIPCHATRKRIW